MNVFQKIIDGVIPAYKVYEDDKFLAFLDITPVQRGHTLLIPKKHTDNLFDIEDNEYSQLFLKAKELAKMMKQKIASERIGLVVEGFGVPHAHIHLIPINNPHDLDSNNKYSASEDELKEVQKLFT